MHQVFGIGSEAVPAPQATLMATIIQGLLNQNLPWGLVLVGVFVSVTLELCGIHSLSFAVGSYLPIATTAPIFAGGLVRWWVERKHRRIRRSRTSAPARCSARGSSPAGRLPASCSPSSSAPTRIAPLQTLGEILPDAARGRAGRAARHGGALPGAGRDRGPGGDAQSGIDRRIDAVKHDQEACTRCHSWSRSAAPSPAPKATPRRLTTVDALRQFPGYFHLQNVLVRGEFAETGAAHRLARQRHRNSRAARRQRDDVERPRRGARAADRHRPARIRRPARRQLRRGTRVARAGRGPVRSCCCR